MKRKEFHKRGNAESVYDAVKANALESPETLKMDESIIQKNVKIRNLDKAVALAEKWLSENRGSPVYIVGDYDSDGINATAIMYWAFKRVGVKVITRIPRRFSEGYGLSEKIIREIPAGSLVITVDNGIAALDAIRLAKEKMMTVIVTDHHLPRKDSEGNIVLPDADIIVDAHLGGSDFEDYCGAAVAFRFMQELLPGMNHKALLVHAAVATVTDVVPLVGPNRELVCEGLHLMNSGIMTPGMKALVNALGIEPGTITEETIGFTIGPALNAGGRLEDRGAEHALELFKCRNGSPEKDEIAALLVNLNSERKKLAKEAEKRAMHSVGTQRPIVYTDETIGEGIIGLVAGKLCETFKTPVIVFTRSGEGKLKGSGRSVPGVNLKKVLDQIQDHIIGYGGHAGAAGLTISADEEPAFREAFKEACGTLPDLSDADMAYDMDLPNNLDETMAEVNKYAPYGEGNPKIRFRLHHKAESDPKFIGDGSHFMIRDRDITIVGFGLSDSYKAAGCPKDIDMIGYLSESWFRGKKSYRFEILSFADEGR